MLRASDYQDLVTFQQNVPTQATGGAPVDVWSDLAKTPKAFAAIEPLGGREFFDAARVNADISHRIRIRYRSDVTERMRVVLGARIFDIAAALEIVRHRELHLMCREFKG